MARRLTRGLLLIPVLASVFAAAPAATPVQPAPHAAPIQAATAQQAAPQVVFIPPPEGGAPATFDITVSDGTGRVPDELRPSDLTVSVDGKARPVVWVRRVSRGPGAMTDAAARLARGSAAAGAATTFAAEPSRTVLIVIDSASFVRGGERTVIEAATLFLDRLGISDRVAVVQLPLSSDRQLVLTAERPDHREALNRVVGRAAPLTAGLDASTTEMDRRRQQTATDLERDRAAEADRAARTERQDQQPVPEPAAARPVEKDTETTENAGRDSLSGLVGLLQPLQPIPGRKIVALFSAGLPANSTARIDQAAAAAVAARTVVYAFGVRSSGVDSRDALDAGALDRLARATGGSFAALSNKPERVIDRAAADLSACFVVGIEPAASDADGKQRSLRVQASRRDLTLRSAASWSPKASLPEDVAPTLQAEAVDAASLTPAPGTYTGAGRVTVAAPPETPPPPPEPRSPELELALGRLVDYVDAYERQYSMLVAEEDYRQSMPQEGVRLRSDLLLVKPERSPEWVSFRDVFEVNGVAVRDREDRLKELFLNPSAQSRAQLQAIKDESARYNIGPLERNINVPLFPLKFLIPANRDRFRYNLAGTPEAEGVRTWRIEYVETARPTLIVDRANNDVPARGWFLVEQLTGAIVESAVTVERDDYTAAIVVRYRRDASLGMWVPDEMKESFKAARLTGWPTRSVEFESILDGTARYSRFRRFQVKTEETVVVPK